MGGRLRRTLETVFCSQWHSCRHAVRANRVSKTTTGNEAIRKALASVEIEGIQERRGIAQKGGAVSRRTKEARIRLVLQHVINGIVLGAQYGLFAVGLALIFGTMNAMNLAYGVTFLASSYVGYVATMILKLPMFPVGFILALLGGALISVVTERVAFWPFRRDRGGDRFSEAVASIAFATFVTNGATMLFGSDALSLRSPLTASPLRFAGMSINPIQLINVGVAVLLLGFLAWFLKYTMAGKALRATAFKERTARLLGINPERIRMFTFASAGALGGAAGILMSMFFGSVHPVVANNLLIKGFAVVVIGGVGSIWGGAIAGVLLGLIESLSVAYFSSALRDVSAYALFFFVLLLRPRGLLGAREVNRA